VDWTLLGAGWALLVGADPALGDGVGATLVGASVAVTELRRTNRTPDTTPAKAPAATRAIIACLLRYHGRVAGLNVKVLLGEGSWPLTSHVLLGGEPGRRLSGWGAGPACGVSPGPSHDLLSGCHRKWSSTSVIGAGSAICSLPNHPSIWSGSSRR
jgi:hypothetical protein